VIKLAVFDLAGTTLLDTGQVPAAFNKALGAGGLAVSAEQLRSVRGAAKREAIGVLVAERFGLDDPGNTARIDAMYAAFKADLLARYQNEGVAFVPGTLKTFAWLREIGVALAINTGFDRVVTDAVIANLPWGGFAVDTVVCGDDVDQGRPAPLMILRAMAQTSVSQAVQVMTVGDTVKDLEAGNNAGVGINVGVLSGAHGRQQLQQVEHTQILNSIADLPSWWRTQLTVS
jgi:phosphonatase-like hydrolase